MTSENWLSSYRQNNRNNVQKCQIGVFKIDLSIESAKIITFTQSLICREISLIIFPCIIR